MFRLLGRLLTWAADALDRNLIMVPDVDEADVALTSCHLDDAPVISVWR